MQHEITPAQAKAKAALAVLEQAFAYFDAEAEITCDTPEYCEYLTAA